jgi:hypothetical protein
MRICKVALWTMSTLLAGTLAGCGGSDGNRNQNVNPGNGAAGDTIAVTSANRVVSFNRATRNVLASSTITGLQASETVLAIDLRAGGSPAGRLYALGSSGRIYTLNPATGAATQVSVLAADMGDTTNPFTGLNGTQFGIDTNTVPDRMRVVSNTGQDLRINFETGATITDGNLTLANAPIAGVTEVAYTNNFSTACRTTLFYLDTTADRLLTTTAPNDGLLTLVGNLGVDASAASGFDIMTGTDGSNTAIAALTATGSTSLYQINLTTGVATAMGAISGLNTGETVTSIALSTPSTNPTQAAGELLALTETNRLITFNNGSPQKSCTTGQVTGLQANEGIIGMDLRPGGTPAGQIYAVGSTGRLYTLDPTSGAATFRFALTQDTADTTLPFSSLSGTSFGVDVNPVADRLRVISDNGQNLRINMDSGVTTTDTPLNPATPAATAAGYTNSFAGASTTTLFVIDTASDTLAIQGQPSGMPNLGDLQTVGSLAITGDVSAATAFEINGRTSAAFAALSIGTATTSDLYSINLTTGAATRVNTIAGGERVRGLTYIAAPVAAVIGLTSDNRLISFNAATPAKLDSDIPITGLQGGEKIFGFDRRPANGKFYAVTDMGRLYTIDTTTGVATPGATLTMDSTDPTPTFSMLAGGNYGADFNPLADRLRLVSDTQENLRINVDTGATTTDTTLNRAKFSVTSAAYTNSFVPLAGSPASPTALFVIDTVNDRLLMQDPPNDGTLKIVGPLGFDVAAAQGFEIVGPDTALAAFVVGTATPALYKLNLTTGAATAVGTIGLWRTTDQVTGLTAAPSVTTPADDSTVFAVVNGTSLATFPRNAPVRVGDEINISGLRNGETIVDVDFRPYNGALYALGTSGRIYVLDATTGAATAIALIDGASMLGTSFGMDVNPVADRLRLVSDLGQNLRINLDNGATSIDYDLNFPAAGIAAAAYTSNFDKPASTTLYDIDIPGVAMLRQIPPNDGVLVPVGKLDAATVFASGGSFDIVGGDDGLALMSLQPLNAMQSTLYRVNLKTGALSPVGPIGPAGTPVLSGMAIRLQ